MSLQETHSATVEVNKTPFNWPIIGFLLFMFSIPALPAVFLLIAVMLGPTGLGEVSEIVNVLHFDTPAAILVHGLAGVLFFITMPFQFSHRLRQKHVAFHEISGKLAVLSGCTMALSGIWMHHVLTPHDLGIRYTVLWIMSVSICLAFALAVRHIIAGNIKEHRKWMVRAVAICLAAVTPIFIEGIVYLVFGQIASLLPLIKQLLHDFGRMLAILMNLAFVEFMFLKEEKAPKMLQASHEQKGLFN